MNIKQKDTHDAACEYIENGYSIFPCKPDSKEPYAAHLPGGSQNTTIDKHLTVEDFEKISDATANNGGYNLAAHTGAPSGFAVVDIDVAKSEEGVQNGERTKESAEALKDQMLAIFGDTRVHRTRSGGYHLFYAFSPALEKVGRKINAFKKNPLVTIGLERGENSEGVTLDLSHIDILAGNGYILLPPSVVEGSEYKMISDEPMGGLPDFPIDLLNELTSNGKRGGVERAYIDLQTGNNLEPVSDTFKGEQRRINAWDNGGEKKLNASLSKYFSAGSGARHDALVKTCATVFAILPYSKWGDAPKYINSVISTFTPPYDMMSSSDADAREVRNAHNWAKAQEWYSRVTEGKRDEEERRKEIEEGSAALGVDEDSYAEQLDKAIESLQTDDKGNPISNTFNIGQLFRLHPLFAGRIRFDSFTEKLTYTGVVSKVRGEHEINNDANNIALIHLIMQVQHMQFPKASKQDVFAAASAVGHEVQYDSYKEFMDSLVGKWDGEERLESWLHKVYQVPNDMYHRALSAQFIFAMVRRAYEPGALFPYVLWLDGEQGVGKSYVCNILASQKWYLEYSDSIDGREINLQMCGKALVDLAEGESVSRASQKRVKALISDQQGIHRTFGSAEVKEHPIRHVWALTNNDGKLVDDTGNRRYLPVKIPLERQKVGDVMWLRAYRKQIFAEAVHKYHEMKKLKVEIQEEIDRLKDADDDVGDILYSLYKKQKMIDTIEMSLSEMNIESDDGSMSAMIKFRTAYGIPYIPQEVADAHRMSAQMQTPLDDAIRAVLYSYDEYLARMPDFSISAHEIYEQLDQDVVRQSRIGNYAFSEIGRRLKIIDPVFESYRMRSGNDKNKRVVRFKYTPADAHERLEAIQRIREVSTGAQGVPSVYSGGNKMVTVEQKAAAVRYHREGGAYLVITDDDIRKEMNKPNSVIIDMSVSVVDDF